MLGGLAALFRWKALAKAAGIDIYSSHRPNLVITSGYQVCWEKFCRYWDIEMRLVPAGADRLYMTAEDAINTLTITPSALFASSASPTRVVTMM